VFFQRTEDLTISFFGLRAGFLNRRRDKRFEFAGSSPAGRYFSSNLISASFAGDEVRPAAFSELGPSVVNLNPFAHRRDHECVVDVFVASMAARLTQHRACAAPWSRMSRAFIAVMMSARRVFVDGSHGPKPAGTSSGVQKASRARHVARERQVVLRREAHSVRA